MTWDTTGSPPTMAPIPFSGIKNTFLFKFFFPVAHQLYAWTLQVHTWSSDANQFVADEDDATYSCRVSGKQLLTELAAAHIYDNYVAKVQTSNKFEYVGLITHFGGIMKQ